MQKALLIWSILVGLLIAVAAVIGFQVAGGKHGTNTETGLVLKPDDPEVIGQGARVYAQYCATCHGADLEGEPDWQTPNPDGTLKAPPHDETGHTWHHSDDLLFRITKFGTAVAINDPDFRSNMPAFGSSLSDEEIIAVLSFIKAQWPTLVRERHDDLNRQSQR
ncbi:putative bifunctional cbb3-type cytochrome c oxidase subunit II/cytochrome c [Roseibium album]|nr:putative bifunctional cbb3-type cytochrome c oxidase subunit II/cytochrome c [Roseibium album]